MQFMQTMAPTCKICTRCFGDEDSHMMSRPGPGVLVLDRRLNLKATEQSELVAMAVLVNDSEWMFVHEFSLALNRIE